MDKIVIRGGNPLLGTVRIMARRMRSACMAAGSAHRRTGDSGEHSAGRDIETTRKLLAAMGAEGELGYAAVITAHDLRANSGRARKRRMNCPRPCVRRRSSWGRWSPLWPPRVSLPGGSPSALALSISISRVWRPRRERSRRSMATRGHHRSSKRRSSQRPRNCFDKNRAGKLKTYDAAVGRCETRHAELRLAKPEVADLGAHCSTHGPRRYTRGNVHDLHQGRR